VNQAVAAAGDGSARPSPLRIAVRVVVMVGLLVASALVLRNVFDELDADAIADALRSLEDAELLALVSMWVLWIACQGLQTAALIPDLPVRRGVVAYLGPAAVASVVPGPSDFPVRYRMLTSWGRTASEATLAVAAGGVFSIGVKLVLPVIAAAGLVLSDGPVEGPMRTIVIVALAVGAGAAALAFVFGSESRTQRVGRLLDPVWRRVVRLMRKEDRERLGARLVAARARALHMLRARWLIASWGTLLAAATRFALLLMSIRFMGVHEADLSWTQVFVAYALVQGLTVVPITAGDAGISELAYVSLLTAAAGSEHVNEITAAVILFRVLTWLAVIPIGLAALGVWRHSVGAAGRPAPVVQDPA
jgi:hypothetical protein